jgi:hypothetical protein
MRSGEPREGPPLHVSPRPLQLSDTPSTMQRVLEATLAIVWAHTMGRSVIRDFPKMQAWTMEPAEGIVLTKQEFPRVEPVPLAFAGKSTT